MADAYIVLDTNVLVSGLLSPLGPPGRIIDLMLRGDLTICFDDRILAEYREVLARPKFGFDSKQVKALLDYIESEGQQYTAAPMDVDLPDPDDSMFLEVAAAAGAEWLVTGNARHYPVRTRHGIKVVDPGEFLKSVGS